jgi:acetyl-CoA C-acetyltransferase
VRDEGSVIINDAWIVEAVPTPHGRGLPDGGRHVIHPQELLAQFLTEALDRVGFDPADVDDAVIGRCGLITGSVTTSTGGGMGIATIIERI